MDEVPLVPTVFGNAVEQFAGPCFYERACYLVYVFHRQAIFKIGVDDYFILTFLDGICQNILNRLNHKFRSLAVIFRFHRNLEIQLVVLVFILQRIGKEQLADGVALSH